MRFKVDTGLITKIKIDTLKNGGGTFDIYNKQQADTGCMCSIKDIAVIDINDFNFFLINKIIEENKNILRRKNIYLGTWIDGNKIYIDISKNYKNKYYCFKIAKKLNQLAIFDLNTFTSMYFTAPIDSIVNDVLSVSLWS